MTQTAGPSYRHLVDLSSPDLNSLFLNPLGQSGDMFSFLYDNLLTMWGVGEYIKMGQYEQTSKEPGNDKRIIFKV
jgi:penicillin amidase